MCVLLFQLLPWWPQHANSSPFLSLFVSFHQHLSCHVSSSFITLEEIFKFFCIFEIKNIKENPMMDGPYGCLAIWGDDKFKFVSYSYLLLEQVVFIRDTTKSVLSESLKMVSPLLLRAPHVIFHVRHIIFYTYSNIPCFVSSMSST